ncbi:MAG: tetratricopeptide repeat protein, partial [Acetobacteraceae bacterium]
VVVLGIATVVSERTGSRHLRSPSIAAAVPALPDLVQAPAELRNRMDKARAQALAPATQLAGLAEFGRLCHANFHTAEAEACWRLLAAAEPRDPRWTYYLADLRGMASDANGMEKWLRKTVELASDYAPAWLRLGDLEFKTGQLDAAEQAYRRRLALVPHDPYASLGLARLALQRDHREEALALIARLVAAVPEFPSAHNLYAEMLSAQGDAAGAARERARGADGRFREADDPWLDQLMNWCFTYDRLCVRGTMEVLTKRADRGQAWFTRAILIQPDRFTAYELLGNLYIDRNEPAKARDVYLAGLRRAGEGRAKIYVSLSRADRMLHEPAEATRIVREGLQAVGDDAELYHELGLALGEQGQNAAAVEALRQAVAHNTTDARTNYDLAVALISAHRLDDAIQALHQSLTLEPTYPATLSLLAEIE